MRGRARIALMVLLLAGAIVAWLAASRRDAAEQPGPATSLRIPGTPGRGLLAAIPADTLLVATFDVRALRRTALGERLLGRGRRIGGLGLVSDVCGSDPMAKVEQLAVAIPGEGADADFAVFATGILDADELLRCAKTVMVQRGGQPVVSPAGAFQVLRDTSPEAQGPELAVAPGGPVLLGEGPFLRTCIDVVEGRLPSVADSPVHAALRRAVGPGVVVATVVLTAQLRRTLSQELALQGAAESPAAMLTGASLSLRIGANLSAQGALRCESQQACSELARLLDGARREQAAQVAAVSPELASVLRGLVLRAQGPMLHLGAAVDGNQAAALLDAFAPATAPGTEPAPSPDPSASAQDAAPAARAGSAARSPGPPSASGSASPDPRAPVPPGDPSPSPPTLDDRR